MILRDVEEVFKNKIVNGFIIISESTRIKVDDFADLFKIAPDTRYNSLIKVDNGKLGYKDFFNECKEQGILN